MIENYSLEEKIEIATSQLMKKGNTPPNPYWNYSNHTRAFIINQINEEEFVTLCLLDYRSFQPSIARTKYGTMERETYSPALFFKFNINVPIINLLTLREKGRTSYVRRLYHKDVSMELNNRDAIVNVNHENFLLTREKNAEEVKFSLNQALREAHSFYSYGEKEVLELHYLGYKRTKPIRLLKEIIRKDFLVREKRSVRYKLKTRRLEQEDLALFKLSTGPLFNQIFYPSYLRMTNKPYEESHDKVLKLQDWKKQA